MQKAVVQVILESEFAQFTRPESKVERTTYDVPTPASIRGALNAIYCKPIEFYYEIVKIEILNPITKIDIRKNELTVKANNSKIVSDANYVIDSSNLNNRTQRNNEYLRNVKYKVTANLVMKDGLESRVTLDSLVKQFNRRVSRGKCFYQPYLGTRECMCNFYPVDGNEQPKDINLDLGYMHYDVFDITSTVKLDTNKKTDNTKDVVQTSIFYAKVEHGVMTIPEWGSGEIFTSRRF